MKYVLAVLLLLVTSPAFAQEKTGIPAARPFPKGTTTLLQPEPEKKKDAVDSKIRQPHVEIWLPPDFRKDGAKSPLLIFSHGFGGCAKQSTFLTSYLADHGYMVIAPDHDDARCTREMGRLSSMMDSNKQSWPERPFRSPDSWTEKTEADRKDDVLSALSFVMGRAKYANYIDQDRMGLMGHSLGGYTVLGIAGAWPSWKDKRFKAVLALSPYTAPYLTTRGLGRINIPVMYQGGTKDDQMTPVIKRTGGAYAQTPAPKYFIEFQDADHFVWTDQAPAYQAIIQRTALAFFDKYLKGTDGEIDEAGTKQVRTFLKDEGKK